MTWHIESDALRAYVNDRLDYAHSASVEAHVVACPTCQTTLRQLVAAVPALVSAQQETWDRLAQVVDQPRLTLLERLLMRLGVGEHTARLVASSELRGRWWLAGVAVLVASVLLALLGSGVAGVTMFLLMAPVVPVAGVALAYGGGGEPVYEVAVVAPYSSFRRILVRSAAALIAWLPVAGLLSVAMPTPVSPAVWLLPALALTSMTLAVCSYVDPVRAAAGVAVLWLAVNSLALQPMHHKDLQLFLEALPQAQAWVQAILLALCCGAVAVTISRRARFERITPT